MGEIGKPVIIRSSQDGDQAGILVIGPASVVYASIVDSDNRGIDIYPQHSTNLGNNSGWIWTSNLIIWDGSESADWETGLNWDAGFVPSRYDNILVNQVGAQPVVVSGDLGHRARSVSRARAPLAR